MNCVTQAECAKRYGVTQQSIQQLVARKVIPLTNGKIDMTKVDAILRKNLSPAKSKMLSESEKLRPVSKDADEDGEDTSYYAARTRRERIGAQLAQLDLDERTAALINAKEARDAQFELARMVRDRMLVIPDRLCALLAVETDAAKVREMLSREIKQALSKAIP